MKKITNIFILFLLILIPINSYAINCSPDAITIKGISLNKVSNQAEEVSNPTIKDGSINLNYKLYSIGDSIRYNLLIKNNSNETINIDNDSLNNKNSYIQYSLISNDNTIEPKAEKDILIEAKYIKEVESDKFENNVFKDNQEITLNLNNQNRITNPLTGNRFILLFLLVILVIQIALYFNYENKKNNINKYLFIMTLSLIPLTVSAYCNITIPIKSNIEIEKCNYKFITSMGSFSETEDIKTICVNDIDNNYSYNHINIYYSSKSRTDNYPDLLFKVSRNKTNFTNTSYIKLYNKNTNELITTITKDQIGEHKYNIEKNVDIYNLEYYYNLGTTLTIQDITIELSPDLQEYIESGKIIYGFLYVKINSYIYNKEWLTNINDINKINSLKESLNGSSFCFEGFSKLVNTNTYVAKIEKCQVNR